MPAMSSLGALPLYEDVLAQSGPHTLSDPELSHEPSHALRCCLNLLGMCVDEPHKKQNCTTFGLM